MDVAFDMAVDVLVVGAGGCGLVAAIRAAGEGASVAILEKNARLMGNTALSSGSIPGAGSRMQRAAGIEDGAAGFVEDLFAVSGSHDADHLTRRLAGISAELVEWLVDEANVELTLVETYRHVGHSVPRLHAPPSRRGTDLLADLEREAARRGIPIAFGQPAVGLIANAGRVVGVETRDAARRTSRIGARAVILASNGFGGSPDLLARFCPDVSSRAIYAGATGSTGEALEWGLALDAGTGNLAAYQGHAGLAARSGNLVTWTVIERGGLIVDGGGKRFGNETIGYSAFAAKEIAARGPLHMLYDARIEADVVAGQPEFAEIARMGDAIAGDAAETLAGKIGVPAAALAKTLKDAGAVASGGGDDAFGRQSWGFGPLAAPYRATRITPALFHTQGGLMVDRDGRVLRADGRPVEGVFAGGGAAAGISGRAGGDGYVSGNGLLSALGLGYLAGHAAARQTVHATAAE